MFKKSILLAVALAGLAASAFAVGPPAIQQAPAVFAAASGPASIERAAVVAPAAGLRADVAVARQDVILAVAHGGGSAGAPAVLIGVPGASPHQGLSHSASPEPYPRT